MPSARKEVTEHTPLASVLTAEEASHQRDADKADRTYGSAHSTGPEDRAQARASFPTYGLKPDTSKIGIVTFQIFKNDTDIFKTNLDTGRRLGLKQIMCIFGISS